MIQITRKNKKENKRMVTRKRLRNLGKENRRNGTRLTGYLHYKKDTNISNKYLATQ